MKTYSKTSLVNGDIVIRLEDEKRVLLNALKAMVVATDYSAPLPEGHPGHQAFLNMVARPRAIEAINDEGGLKA